MEQAKFGNILIHNMFKKIKEYWIQKDKLQHCLLAALINNMLIIVFLFAFNILVSIGLSTLITIILCALKELIDYCNKTKGVANIHDVNAGIIGVLLIDIQWLIFFALYKFFPIFVV